MYSSFFIAKEVPVESDFVSIFLKSDAISKGSYAFFILTNINLFLLFAFSRCSISYLSIDFINGVSFSNPKFLVSKLGRFFCNKLPTSPRNAQPYSSDKSLMVVDIRFISLLVILSISDSFNSLLSTFSSDCFFKISI